MRLISAPPRRLAIGTLMLIPSRVDVKATLWSGPLVCSMLKLFTDLERDSRMSLISPGLIVVLLRTAYRSTGLLFLMWGCGKSHSITLMVFVPLLRITAAAKRLLRETILSGLGAFAKIGSSIG